MDPAPGLFGQWQHFRARFGSPCLVGAAGGVVTACPPATTMGAMDGPRDKVAPAMDAYGPRAGNI